MAKHGSHSVSFGRCELFKRSIGGGGWGWGENKNKFEKLKANRSQSKERKFVPKCRRKNLLGVFAIIGPVQVGVLKQFLRLLFLSREGLGARGEGGCQIRSVINEHFKRPNCGR